MAPGLVGPIASPDAAGRRGCAAGAVGRQARDGALHADVPKSGRHAFPRVVLHFLEVAPAGVVVAIGAVADLAAEQLVDRHVGALALDVPQRDVHAAHRVEQHAAVSPVRADVGRLPDIFDLVDVAPDEKRLEVLLDGGLHHQGALGEGGAAIADQARFARHDLHDDQSDPVRRGEDGLDVGDLDGRQPLESCRPLLGLKPRGEVREQGSSCRRQRASRDPSQCVPSLHRTPPRRSLFRGALSGQCAAARRISHRVTEVTEPRARPRAGRRSGRWQAA